MTTELCPFCGREASHRIFVCSSTRDMEEWAIRGFDTCYRALAAAGGGERGMERVDLLRREHDAQAAAQRARALQLLDEMAAEELDLP